MPFDHVISIAFEQLGARNAQGVYIPGPVTTGRFWAEIEDGGTEDEINADGSGTITISIQTVRLRWNAAIALSSPAQMSITDAYGRVLTVQAVRADDERRRYVELDVTGIVG